MTKHTEDSLEQSNLIGLSNIIKHGGVFASPVINIAMGASVGLSLIAIFSFDLNFYEYIKKVTDILISVVPSLLGFTIAGYSFLMAFIPQRLMDRISEPLGDTSVSLYQSITSSLAFNLFQHAIILIISCGIYLTVFIQENNRLKFPKSPLTDLVNKTGFVLINLLLAIALAVIVQIIISSFNLAQLYHYDVNKQKVDEMKNSQNRNNNSESSAGTKPMI